VVFRIHRHRAVNTLKRLNLDGSIDNGQKDAGIVNRWLWMNFQVFSEPSWQLIAIKRVQHPSEPLLIDAYDIFVPAGSTLAR